MKGIQLKIFIISLFLCTLLNGEYNNKVQSQTVVKTIKSWDKSTLPHYPKGQPEITILQITIPPNTTLPMHIHPVINAGVVIKGRLKVVKKEGETLYLKKGDSIVELVNTLHYGVNETNQPVELMMFYAGEKGKPITVLEKELKKQ